MTLFIREIIFLNIPQFQLFPSWVHLRHHLIENNPIAAIEYTALENVTCLIAVWNWLSVIHPRVTMKASVGTRIFELSLGKHRRKACHQKMDAIIWSWARRTQTGKPICWGPSVLQEGKRDLESMALYSRFRLFFFTTLIFTLWKQLPSLQGPPARP